MKVRKEYMIKEVEGKSYLLPYGQGIALHFNGTALDEDGVFLWEFIRQGYDEAACAAELAKHRGVSADSEEVLSTVRDFFQILENLDIINRRKQHLIGPLADYDVFEIAGLRVMYNGPREYIAPELQLYRVKSTMEPVNLEDISEQERASMQRVEIVMSMPHLMGVGELLTRTHKVIVYADDRHYYYLFPYNKSLREMRVRKDGSKAVLFISDMNLPDEEITAEVYEAMHQSFLILAFAHGKFAFTSWSLQYQNKGYLFVSSDGTNWRELTERLADLSEVMRCNHRTSLLEIDGDHVNMWNIPWGSFLDEDVNRPLQLGGVISIRQSATNHMSARSTSDCILFATMGMESPMYSRELTEGNIDFVTKVNRYVPIWRIHCNQTNEAIEYIKSVIDAGDRN
ncbi:MAG: PqqD family protein [Lachnospiraceae bacterium]|nr:PqqD family protein [Lachnospiraceae bacterium]